MNREIAQEWVRRLRSGEYAQGKAGLRRDTLDTSYYCCLGVLCEMAVEQGLISITAWKTEDKDDGQYAEYSSGVPESEGSSSYLPSEVMAWAGMRDRMGTILEGQTNLAFKNDQGLSFAAIADLIDGHVEKL